MLPTSRENQDKGYGSKLLSFIKEYSKEIGCSEMFLITDKGNPRDRKSVV